MPVVTGHVYVFAWWYAMGMAFTMRDAKRAAALLQAGLTVSAHDRWGLTVEQQAVWSIQESERWKAMNRHSDNFLTFAVKAWTALGEDGQAPGVTSFKRTTTLVAMGVNLHTTPVNKTSTP